MSLQISFNLSESDLEHFRRVMAKAREAASGLSERDILNSAHRMLDEVREAETSDFIADSMERLETLIGMVVDRGWGLEDEDRQRVVQALAYFAEPEDLIPDHIPGLGFLDDAIMIQLVARELRHEIDAYRDFCVFRAAEGARLGDGAEKLDRSDWLEERRKQLHSRMRHRRRRRGGRGSGRSPFDML